MERQAQIDKQKPAKLAAELREFFTGGYNLGKEKAPGIIRNVKITRHWFREGGEDKIIPLLYFSYDKGVLDLNKTLELIRKEFGSNGLRINSSYDGEEVFSVHVSKRCEEDLRYAHYTQIEGKHTTVTLDEDGKRILSLVLPECISEGLM